MPGPISLQFSWYLLLGPKITAPAPGVCLHSRQQEQEKVFHQPCLSTAGKQKFSQKIPSTISLTGLCQGKLIRTFSVLLSFMKDNKNEGQLYQPTNGIYHSLHNFLLKIHLLSIVWFHYMLAFVNRALGASLCLKKKKKTGIKTCKLRKFYPWT